MSSTAELIQDLYERRMKAVEELHATVEEVEAAGGTWTAEDQQKQERINGDIDALGNRVDNLIQMSKQGAELDEQRKRFEKIVRPDGNGSQPDEEEERMRNFVRAASPLAETWAPKVIELKITDDVKRAVRLARRHGMSVSDPEFRDLSKLTDAAGKYTVPAGFVAQLYEHLVERAAVRQTRAGVLTTASGETLLVPRTTTHGTDAAIIAEAGAITEADPAFGQVSLTAFKYGKLVQVSSELATDTAIDLLGYVARAAGLSLGQGSGTHFVTGTGTAGGGGTQPEGVMTNITAGKTMPTGNTLGFTTAGTAADSLFMKSC